MNIAYEFSRVKGAFKKVRNDMDEITEQIYENYNHFVKQHEGMQDEIKKLSKEIKEGLLHFNDNHLKNIDSVSHKEILDISKELSDLKKEISQTYHKSREFNDMLELVKKNKKSLDDNEKNMRDLKDKVRTNELEIYLLKEKLAEKDLQLHKLKDVNKHMLDIIDDISRAEIEILNKTA